MAMATLTPCFDRLKFKIQRFFGNIFSKKNAGFMPPGARPEGKKKPG
jgi:hypothetical protein